MKQAEIVKVSGPLVIAKGMEEAKMYEVVKVGEPRLIGEIIELKGDQASIQVYEETAGIGPGEPVLLTGQPLCVELGPGLISSIYDGIQRPLDIIRANYGDYIPRGIEIPSLDRQKKWRFHPLCKKADQVVPGDIIGEVQESVVVKHRILVPVGLSGSIEEIKEGEFTVEETIARVKDKNGKIKEICMLQKWPVRKARPYQEKISPDIPLVVGQRVIDTFFPIAKGGVACVPGPFGSGKTVVQHEIAKWSDADIIVFIGCGERGNEMADVLLEFPTLKDPRTNEPLMNRSILIANTSNMPVAAREASIYTGVTLAEYYRDMGYDVALMADSTSRWAEALREISGRLEEMPGEEGYPAYLGMRVAQFYERAARVRTLGSNKNVGSLSVIGSISPPGGDLADPVVQATLRITKVFWSLEDKLAYKRHFPAINWLSSYSLYLDNIKEFLKEKIGEDFLEIRNLALRILQQEEELQEIARLVGIEALSIEDRFLLEISRSIRENFLHQNAFDPVDTYTPLSKQYKMLRLIISFYKKGLQQIKEGVSLEEILKDSLREKIRKSKFASEADLSNLTPEEGEKSA